MGLDKEKRILVTGGLGFIGSNFIRHILKNRPEYSVINLDKLTYCGNLHNLKEFEHHPNYKFVQGDICDQTLMNELVSKVDYVVNFAAESHVDKSFHEPKVFTHTNVFGVHTLLEAMRQHPVKKFLHIGTDEVYGSLAPDEESKHEDCKLHPRNPYSASKAGADMQVLAYHVTYGVPAVISRSSNNFGPYQYPEKLVPLSITNALRDLPIPVHGTGEYIRDWMYVEDNCRALMLILEKGEPGQIYNVGADNEYENIYILKKILGALGKPETLFRFVKNRPSQDLRYSLDSKKVQELGWKPEVSVEEGLKKTVQWYKENDYWWKGLIKKYNRVEEEEEF